MKGFTDRWERGVIIFLDDLHLLASLYLAQFIVWRTVSRQRRERTAGLRSIRLVELQPSKRFQREFFDGIRRTAVQDVIYIGLTVVFFLIALAYVRACEKLR